MQHNCRTCGACCVGIDNHMEYCDILPKEISKVTKSFASNNIILLPSRNTAAIKTKWKKMKTGPLAGYELNICAALRGSVMNQVSCSIYKNRPSTCHNSVVPGDKVCSQLRKAFRKRIEDIIKDT